MNNYHFDAVIFDLDGVITKTALVHAAAWKEMFDEFLRDWEKKTGKPFLEFTHLNDYLPYVDGKPRYKGVESFLKSRNIKIPYGTPEDSPNTETICGLGNRKNQALNEILKRDGVEVYESTVKLMEELKSAGIKLGVASSSKNCKQVLERANLLHYFETRVDGEVSAELGLKGKPEPDIFKVACDNLGVEYWRTVIVEDAVSGVQAAVKGNFGLVLGIAREGNEYELKTHGADIVVNDLEELEGIWGIERWFHFGLSNALCSFSFFGYDKDKEAQREAVMSIGNGYFETLGALEESDFNKYNHPFTYVSESLNSKTTAPLAYKVSNQLFFNAPNWLPISFKVADGCWFDPNVDEILELERNINFLNGILLKKMVARDRDGRETLIESRRFISMSNAHHAGIDYSLTPINYTGYIRVKLGLSIPGEKSLVEPYKSIKLEMLEPVKQGAKDNISYILARSQEKKVEIAAASKIEVFFENKPLATNFKIKESDGWVNTYIKASIKEGQTLRIEKLVSICNSSPDSQSDPLMFVLNDAKKLDSFGVMHAASIKEWDLLWDKVELPKVKDRQIQKHSKMRSYHSLINSAPEKFKDEFIKYVDKVSKDGN